VVTGTHVSWGIPTAEKQIGNYMERSGHALILGNDVLSSHLPGRLRKVSDVSKPKDETPQNDTQPFRKD
jgi:hypothetical protein